MKFLCDNCKAKYQIADEKVAGKTVRMKCRKCGHQIEVRAAVTETSVSKAPPAAPARPATRSALATSLSTQKPRVPQSGATGALAGAFQRTVQDGGPSTSPFGSAQSSVQISVTDEWYVAINGVPVGPVRISELRRKAAAGAVSEDSLCWQEGLEEWRPIRAVPELAALVREAMLGNRPSLAAPPPSENRPSLAPPKPAPPRPPPAPPAKPALPNRSNVVPLRPAPDDGQTVPLVAAQGAVAATAFAPQVAEPIAAPPPEVIADPFAVPAPVLQPAVAATPAPPSVGAISSPLVPSAPSLAPSFEAPRRAGTPLWFWLVALFTVSFGAVAAYALFFRVPPAPTVIVNSAPPPAPTPTEPATAKPTESVTEIPDPAPPTSAATAATTTKVATSTRPAATTGSGGSTTTPDRKTADLSGLLGGTGSGPGVGSGSTHAGGGGGLDQSSVERVVAAHRTGVKRTCWERGGGDQKASVNVTVSATVGPAGNVVGTSSSGDDPVVAKCIEQQVRGWMFSAPGSNTTVNIPFKFVRQ